ncbi:MAG: M20/M25/M40 family metallo-hydrolase [Polyangiales bacterium]
MARRLSGKKFTIGAVLFVLAVLVVLLLLFFANRKVWHAKPFDSPPELSIDRRHAAEALASYIRIDTSTPPGIEPEPEPEHIGLLIDRYIRPLGLEHEVIADRSLLVRWPAGEADDVGGPALFLSHSDVVPVGEDDLSRWTHPPFSGHIGDGYVWGRGAIDNKASTICQLEAIKALKDADLRPHRDIVLLVVPDEEIGGERGAGLVVREHREALGDPWAVFDEGSFVVPDFVEGATVAPVAIGEKRYVTIRLTVEGEGGHSSMPGTDDPPDVLAAALGKLSGYRQPPRITEPVAIMLDRMASEMPFGKRVVLRNDWLFGRLVEKELAKRPASNAIMRDTMALTMLRSGVKDNVVPGRAQATYNLRLLPGSDLDAVLGRIERRIGDPRVEVEVADDWGETPIAPWDDERFFRLARSLKTAMPEVLVTPTLTPATMDARWFAQNGMPTYRLVPFTLDRSERQRVHGIDERISLDNLEQATRVYAHIMRFY